jgi:AAA family ATP:ADP antiporter
MNKKYKAIIKKLVPIHRHEIVKFSCVSLLIFLIVYVHSVLHIAKDVLVISHLGTEAISAIELCAVLPISLVFMFFYIKLADKLTRSGLFHAMNWFFISYFVIFALVFYPNRHVLSIDISDAVILRLPYLKHLFKIISNWHYCLFYVFAQSWVTIMLAISFWQTANHITTIEESKRFYPLFGAATSLGLLLACVLSNFFVVDGADWQPTLNSLTISIVVAGLALSLCLIVLERIVGTSIFNLKKGHFKAKISFKESLRYIVSSRPILLITSLLLCYNISINLIEGVWKKSVEVLFNSNANLIHHFMSNVNMYIAVLSMIFAFIGVYMLQSCKWKTSALITPIVAIITGGMFFLFMILKETSFLLALQTSALAIAVCFGAINNIFFRATKYTLFDSTKEMVYIPLDDDLQIKGKAAAETVGVKFGKAGGSLIQQILLVLFPALTLLDLSPIISVIFLAIMLWWLYSTVVLGNYLKHAGSHNKL